MKALYYGVELPHTFCSFHSTLQTNGCCDETVGFPDSTCISSARYACIAAGVSAAPSVTLSFLPSRPANSSATAMYWQPARGSPAEGRATTRPALEAHSHICSSGHHDSASSLACTRADLVYVLRWCMYIIYSIFCGWLQLHDWWTGCCRQSASSPHQRCSGWAGLSVGQMQP